jgi:tellurite resistance protein TerB
MFGFMKKMKGAGAEIANKSLKAENKDLMEAMVGAATLIAFASGSLDDAEVLAIDGIIANTKALQAFGNEPSQEFDRLCKVMESGYRMGRLNVMKEINDVKNNKEDAEMVLVMAIEVAYADGDCEPAEESFNPLKVGSVCLIASF